jgi:hypothetical protein
VRRGTRFDAELRESLSFGSESIPREALASLGAQPPPDSLVSARLLTPLDSASSRQGDASQAVLTEPLYGPGHTLVLPQGTVLKGSVVMARRARWFHRSGRLRFNFLNIELPPEVTRLRGDSADEIRTQGILQAAEGSGGAIQVDSEGGVKATEPKARLIAPLISLVAASRAADNDAGRAGAGATNTAGGNVSGRTLGGGLGFGLLGSVIAQRSRYVGMSFGYYGLAWSVFSNVIARGSEVRFEKNALLEIKFGGRAAPAGGNSSGEEKAK